MKQRKILILCFLICLLSSQGLYSQNNCCRGYLQMGCVVLSGTWIKIGLVCNGSPTGSCIGEIHNFCTGQNYRPVGCTGVFFPNSIAIPCY
jgi:hypothetical protein